MHNRIQPSRRGLALQAIAAAIVAAAALAPLPRPASALVALPPGAGPAAPPPSRPPVVAPDPDNTGNPDDPAAATTMPRDPGDLMNAGTLVYVDDSFQSVSDLRKAIREAGQSQSQAAIADFQKIVTQYGQKLVLLNDNSYVSITDFVRERLLQMPAVRNGMYDQMFGAEARREVDAAIEDADLSKLIRVSDLYFPSAAAFKGLSQAAEWYFERGEFTAAARTWRELLQHPLVGDRQAELIFRAALAEHLGRDASGAKALREQLARDFPEASGTVSGKQARLLPRLDELLAMPAWERTDLSGDDWPAFEGGPDRARLLNTHAAIGARLWGVPLSESLGVSALNDRANQADVMVQQRLAVRRGVAPEDIDAEMLTSHPVMAGGRLFVHTGNQVYCVSANAGTRLWTYPADAAPIDQATQNYIRNYGVNPRLTAHDSASVFGDQVFAVLPVSSQANAQGISYYNGVAMLPMRMVCLDRSTGQMRWTRVASSIKTEKDAPLMFVGSPLVTRQGVYVMARRSDNNNFSQQYLVRLDRETGEATWSCYLCSIASNAMYSGMGAALSNVPVPTLVDDVVYVSTGQGADCAIDANVGRILWLRPTLTGKAGDVAARTTLQPTLYNSWKYNAPLVVGDTLITAGAGEAIRLYDRWTGRLKKAITAGDLIGSAQVTGNATIDVLAGAVGTRIVLSVRNASFCFDVAELEKDNPRPLWSSVITGAGSPKGRPFLASTGYYVPFDSKLVRIDLESGKSEQWEWPQNDKSEPGKPGNLLVTSEQVIVVNDREVAGYSKWETALQNRLARIQASPQSAEPYLDLAEISFRTNHPDLAQENMVKAVQIAGAGSMKDLINRLYRTNFAFAEQLLTRNDASLWPQSRFYYEQCRATARDPEQESEWRLRLGDLAIKQKRPDEAAELFTQVLTSPSFRDASFRDADTQQSAGSSAEARLQALLKEAPAAYKPFEDQAGTLTQRALAAKDPAGLQQVVDGYPNSQAALRAATALFGLLEDKQEWDQARRTLFWLLYKVDGPQRANVMAHLSGVRARQQKYASAMSFASQGLSQFPDFSWTQNGQKLTFASLLQQIGQDRPEFVGRLPALKVGPTAREMQDASDVLGKDQAAAIKPADLVSFLPVVADGHLLSPLEETATARQPNLLLVVNRGELAMLDSSTPAEKGVRVRLPQNEDAVLLGTVSDVAVLLQSTTAVGVNVKTHQIAWTQDFKSSPLATPAQRNNPNRGTYTVGPGNDVQVLQGIVYVNGRAIGSADSINLVDTNGNPYLGLSGSDPESIRRAAIAALGTQNRFSSARLLNGMLYLLQGNEINAFDARTGKPAWPGANGKPVPTRVPDTAGASATCFVGNEDFLIVQVDATGGKGTTFCAIDADSGKIVRSIKLEGERTLWRGLGADDTLYVITDDAVRGYDLISSRMWQRRDIGTRFSAAAALTLDGLIVVNDDRWVEGLAPRSGDTRWKIELQLDLLNNAASANVRSLVAGGQILFQSPDGSVMFNTAEPLPSGVNRLAWRETRINDPVIHSGMQFSDSILVELLSGTLAVRNAAANAVGGAGGANLLIIDRKGGKIFRNQPLAAPGKTVRSWQVVDGGIAFEVSDAGNTMSKVYLWHTR